jgi:hypothetical protein
MNVQKLTLLLNKVKAGKITIEEALGQLRSLPFEDLGFTRVDHHRSLRKGFPEVIWGRKLRGDRVHSEVTEGGQNICARLDEKGMVQGTFPKSHYPGPSAHVFLSGQALGKDDPSHHRQHDDIPVAEEAAGSS